MPEKSMKRKTFTLFICCITIAAMLSGCGNKKKDQDLADMLEKTGEDAAIEIEDPQNDKTGEPEKREDDIENDKDEKTDPAPVYCIGGPNDIECETIHIIDERGSYKALSDQLEALNDNFLKAAYGAGTDNIVSNICVRRADDKVFSFVHEYRESMGEVDFVQMRGYSFLTDSGKKLELSDIVADEDRFYELLSDELHKNVTEDMMIITGEYNISADDFDAQSVIKQCLNEKRYGWVLDPQGVTFWFEKVNAILPKASATVLFSTDKEGKVFNDEFAGNVSDEWIMRIPESYSSETYFDCNDDGTVDEIYWYADSGYQGDVFVDSGLGVKFNGRYFGSEEICPADDMPWTHYSVYLMHKDKQTVLVAHYYEEADSVWSSFSLTNDLVKSVDNVYAYPEYENYSDAEIGWLVPVDMSAIKVYSDRGGDETIEYPDEILTVETDGRMKVSELSTKSRKSSPGPTDGSDKKGPKTGLSKAEAGEDDNSTPLKGREEPFGKEVKVDAATQKKMNIFLSNFSEAHLFEYDKDDPDPDSLFWWAHLWTKLNKRENITYEEHAVGGNVESCEKISVKDISKVTEKYLDLKYTEDMAGLVDTGKNDWKNCAYDNGYFYVPAADGESYTNFTVVSGVEDLGDNKLKLCYTIYSQELDAYFEGKEINYGMTDEEASRDPDTEDEPGRKGYAIVSVSSSSYKLEYLE